MSQVVLCATEVETRSSVWVVSMRPSISKHAQNFFELAQACTSLYKLVQAKKTVKYHKCQSNLFFGQKLIFELFVKSKKKWRKTAKIQFIVISLDKPILTFSLFYFFTCASRKVKKFLYNLLMYMRSWRLKSVKSNHLRVPKARNQVTLDTFFILSSFIFSNSLWQTIMDIKQGIEVLFEESQD